jgi:hypothetical protein
MCALRLSKKTIGTLSLVLIVGGMVMLLSAWISQQVLYEKWREQLADIAFGESIFNSYASAHSFFELLLMNAPEKDRVQIMAEEFDSYWMGLNALRAPTSEAYLNAYFKDVWDKLPKQDGDVTIGAIPDDFKKPWRISLQIDSTWPSFKEAILDAQATINAVARIKRKLEVEKSRAQIAFWILYILGSAAFIAGQTVRLTQGFGEATEHPEGS